MLDDDGHVHVADFGMRVRRMDSMTMTGTVLGRWLSLAEQAQGDRAGAATTATRWQSSPGSC